MSMRLWAARHRAPCCLPLMSMLCLPLSGSDLPKKYGELEADTSEIFRM